MREYHFEPGEYYHIYNRGVEKRSIFTNDNERVRFVNSLYLFNNFRDIPNRFDVRTLEPRELLTPIKPLVSFAAASLMPNHFHLFLSSNVDGGISKFMHKVMTGYTKYFNIKHERSGRLFESTFKAKRVLSNEYAGYLTQYIHLNHVILYQAKLGTEELRKAVESYRWSTLPDYLGNSSNFSLLDTPVFRRDILGFDAEEYKEFFLEVFRGLYQA